MFKIEYQHLTMQVYNAVKTMIVQDVLHPGQKIVQEEIAQQLGVSRTPLLSALSKLEQEGLIETIPRRGAFVKKYSTKELINLYNIRIRLETLGAKEAAKNADKEHIKILETYLKSFDKAIKEKNSTAYRETDYQFHLAIMEASGNSFLHSMVASSNVILICNVKGILKPLEQSYKEHVDIVNAIKTGDEKKAEELMAFHLEDSKSHINSISQE
ncbi:GntR family transcriptional regulator [Spirochaetia bacterium 38H-sp]|uniref:GntR family transcriptional regulator n=1 Tax=Rarispira pelagica TaxID=3141764 RepID=A0ABU9UAH9_9SPIR